MKNGNDEIKDLPEADYREWMVLEAFEEMMKAIWQQDDISYCRGVSFAENKKRFLIKLRNKRNNYDRTN